MRRTTAAWLATMALVLAFAALTQAQGPREWWERAQRQAPPAAPGRALASQSSNSADYERLLAAVEETSRSLRHEQLHRLMHQQRRGY